MSERPYDIEVRVERNRYHAHLQIDNQGFWLTLGSPMTPDGKAEAEWFCEQLRKALDKVWDAASG